MVSCEHRDGDGTHADQYVYVPGRVKAIGPKQWDHATPHSLSYSEGRVTGCLIRRSERLVGLYYRNGALRCRIQLWPSWSASISSQPCILFALPYVGLSPTYFTTNREVSKTFRPVSSALSSGFLFCTQPCFGRRFRPRVADATPAFRHDPSISFSSFNLTPPCTLLRIPGIAVTFSIYRIPTLNLLYRLHPVSNLIRTHTRTPPWRPITTNATIGE